MQVSKQVFATLALALLTPLAAAQDIRLSDRKTRWRFTAEHLSIDSRENLGLVGVHYDLLNPVERIPDLYVGVGGYGGLVGKRGGLFAGGLSAGYLKELTPGWMMDVGLFAGGGGGGGNGGGRAGSGLLLRPHVALERVFDFYALRLEVTNVDFVDEDIDDLHIALGITLPSEMLEASESGRVPQIPAKALKKRRLRVTPQVAEFHLDHVSRSVSGRRLRKDIQMAGFGLDYFISENIYIPVEAFGATSGGVSGFGSAMAGIGLSLPIAFEDRMSLELKALGGAGGGGDVDTGGGLLGEIRAGMKVPIYGPLSVDLSYGYVEAARGDFEASMITAGLTWRSHVPALRVDYPRSRLAREGLSEASAQINTTRLQLLNKIYVPHGKARTTEGKKYDKTLNLLGVGFEQPVSPSFAVLGRMYAAWEGDIGGYMEGLLGLKYEFTPFVDERHHFFVSGEVGAGGGGGMDVGSGLIYQTGAGYRYELTDRASFTAEWGYMQPDRGSFQAESIQIGVAWDLLRAYLR